MTNLLFLDFETQSEDPSTTNITEAGATPVTVDEGLPVRIEPAFSQLCWAPGYPPQTEEIVDITGITDEMLITGGIPPTDLMEKLFKMISEVDYVLAHKRSFDQTVYESVAKRLGLTPAQPKKGWICTLEDVPYPKKFRCKKLSHLAYDHGIVVDPGGLHRAGYDTDLLAKLIVSKYKLEDILKYKHTPWAYVRAKVPPPWEDGGVGTGQAKKLGYGWQRAPGTEEPEFMKMWVKRVKEDQLQAEKAKAPFPITRLMPPGE